MAGNTATRMGVEYEAGETAYFIYTYMWFCGSIRTGSTNVSLGTMLFV